MTFERGQTTLNYSELACLGTREGGISPISQPPCKNIYQEIVDYTKELKTPPL